MAGNGNLPTQWKPGESGNPAGSSEKARSRRRLRDALGVLMANEAPDALKAALPDELLEMLPQDLTIAELQAFRVVMVGSLSKKPAEILEAARIVLNLEKDTASEPDPDAEQAAGVGSLEPVDEQRDRLAKRFQLATEEGESIQ